MIFHGNILILSVGSIVLQQVSLSCLVVGEPHQGSADVHLNLGAWHTNKFTSMQVSDCLQIK